MMMPFESGFRISSPFGRRTDPITGDAGSWHGGVDLVGADRNVRAVCAGTVINSRIITDPNDLTSEWGNYVSIWGDDGKVCYYCHLDSRAVEKGQRVSAGQIIGIEGMTGRCTGIHLHFELRDAAGYQEDPCAYLGIPNLAGYIWTPEPAYIRQASPWAKDAAAWAVEKKIVTGRGEGDFAWQQPVTREELAVMLYRAREVF